MLNNEKVLIEEKVINSFYWAYIMLFKIQFTRDCYFKTTYEHMAQYIVKSDHLVSTVLELRHSGWT